MTAKEFLGQAYRLDQRINSKLQQIDSLRSLTQKVTQSYDNEVVSRTRNVSSLEDAIIRLMGLENLMSRLPHSPACRRTCGTPHKAAVPVPGVWLLPVPA